MSAHHFVSKQHIQRLNTAKYFQRRIAAKSKVINGKTYLGKIPLFLWGHATEKHEDVSNLATCKFFSILSQVLNALKASKIREA